VNQIAPAHVLAKTEPHLVYIRWSTRGSPTGLKQRKAQANSEESKMIAYANVLRGPWLGKKTTRGRLTADP